MSARRAFAVGAALAAGSVGGAIATLIVVVVVVDQLARNVGRRARSAGANGGKR